MGGVDDDEPPSKRVKVSSIQFGSLSKNSYLSEPISPFGGPMAKPLPSQGEEDMVGSKGIIKKVEFVRIITKALYSLDYEKSGAALEEESGIQLHSSVVNLFRKQVLDGHWDESVATLHKIGLVDDNILKSASFLVWEKKFFELLEENRVMDALKTLRSEITPLCINKTRVHELSSCIVSPSQSVFSDMGIKTANSRLKLLGELQKLLPPTIMIPENRLDHLVEQALNVQREACFYHNSLDSSLSLYTDHRCGKDQIPSRTTQVDPAGGDAADVPPVPPARPPRSSTRGESSSRAPTSLDSLSAQIHELRAEQRSLSQRVKTMEQTLARMDRHFRATYPATYPSPDGAGATRAADTRVEDTSDDGDSVDYADDDDGDSVDDADEDDGDSVDGADDDADGSGDGTDSDDVE